MAVNPYGMVMLADGGAPRIITGVAREVISGGQFVGVSGDFGVVGSNASTFVSSDIKFIKSSALGACVGMAINDAASGAPLAVATRGLVIVPHAGSFILPGQVAYSRGDGDVQGISGTTASTVLLDAKVGKAITGASGTSNYLVLDLGA